MLLLAGLCLAALLLQVRNGVYSSDIGADPDEPSHAVTALMMRDYLVQGLPHGANPLKFAQDYYSHFPKVALGHYPPLFYVLAGAWMVPCASKLWLMALMGIMAGFLGWLTALLGVRCGLCRPVATLVGLWSVLLPLSQKQAMLVMSDSMLACALLLAVWAFAQFMERPSARYSLIFGTMAAVTILIKGSGAALALVPPLAIASMRGWRLLLNWRLWIAPLPVLATALPWTLATMHITQEGMTDTPVSAYVAEAAKFYAWAAGYSFGPVILVSAGMGVVFASARGLKALPVCLAAMMVAVMVLYLVSPTGLSSRYLLPLMSPLLIASGSCVELLHHWWSNKAAGVLAMTFMMVLSIWMLGEVPTKNTTGFGVTASELLSRADEGKVLVSSDARGEGGLIAELAFRLGDRVQSRWTVVRASKFLASSDWIGRGYTLRFKDLDALKAGLRDENITFAVVDASFPTAYRMKHQTQMDEWAMGKTALCEIQVTRHDATTPGTLKLLSAP